MADHPSLDRPQASQLTAYVLATGPSMSQAVADSVRGRGVVIAVSDAVYLAPWADCLVSTDAAWWNHHRTSMPDFKGRRVCSTWVPDTHQPPECKTYENSGVLAIRSALCYYRPSKIVLLGVDFGGSHFFGPHPEPLKNTPDSRWPVFQRQYDQQLYECRQSGIELVNATPGSRLKNIPMELL